MDRDDKNYIQKSQMLFNLQLEGVRNKYSILPIVSGLMIAVLALGVSGNLFQINILTKLISTLLLLLSVLSLQIYLSEALSLSTAASKALDEHLRRERSNYELSWKASIIYLFTGKINGEVKKSDFWQRLSSQFPSYAVLVLWIVVILMIIEIWC